MSHLAHILDSLLPAPPVALQGFDEYMNVVLDDAEELSIKKKSRKALGRILLKGDNITLMMSAYAPLHIMSSCPVTLSTLAHPAVLCRVVESHETQPIQAAALLLGYRAAPSPSQDPIRWQSAVRARKAWDACSLQPAAGELAGH
jgi:hypothetical protein